MSWISLTKTPPEAFSVEGAFVPFQLNVAGYTVNISETVFVQLLVTIILGTVFFLLGRNLKERPEGKRQLAAEALVGFVISTVENAMGSKYKNYVYYIGSLMSFSLISSLMGLLGLKAPTSDLSVVSAWGCITLVLIIRNKIKTGGVKGFLSSYVQPMSFLLPSNIIGELSGPFSQALRHFANILGGSVIMGLIYFSLSSAATGLAAIGVPAVLSLYFDLFASCIQAFIFATLTMIYVLNADCSEE